MSLCFLLDMHVFPIYLPTNQKLILIQYFYLSNQIDFLYLEKLLIVPLFHHALHIQQKVLIILSQIYINQPLYINQPIHKDCQIKNDEVH